VGKERVERIKKVRKEANFNSKIALFFTSYFPFHLSHSRLRIEIELKSYVKFTAFKGKLNYRFYYYF